MKIKMSLQRTKMLDEAKNSKSYFIVFEILIFIAVFAAGTILEGLIVGVPMIRYLMNSEEYISASQAYFNHEITVDELSSRVTEAVTNLPERFTIIMLFATAAATITAMIYCRCFEKRKLPTMGFRRNDALKEYLVGALIGTGIFSIAVGICLAAGALSFDGFNRSVSWSSLGLLFLGFLIQGMSEEVILRGYFLVSLQRRIPLTAAIIISSVAFACLHLQNPGMNALAFVNIALFGVFAGVYMLKRGSIWGVCAIHSLWNFIQGNFYGINVSGMGNMTTVFKMTSVGSKELFNGGDFGLEGGLGVTIVLILGIAVMLCTKTKESELAAEKEYDEETSEE